MNTPVNENHALIQEAVTKVLADAEQYGYDATLNAFHLQLMLKCYVDGMDSQLLCEEMQAGEDTTRAFWMIINH